MVRGDIRLTCPACGPSAPLAPAGGTARALACARCRGALLRGGSVQAEEVAARASSNTATPGPCPSCESPLAALDLDGREVGRCTECDLWWIPAARAVMPTRPRRWARAVVVPACVLSLSGAVWAALARRAPADPAPAAARDALPPSLDPPAVRRAVIANAPAPAAAAGAFATEPRPAIPSDMLFGGRPVRWWEQRLEQLASRTDEEGRRVYLATRRRAAAHDLVASERSGHLVLEPNEKLARTLREGAHP